MFSIPLPFYHWKLLLTPPWTDLSAAAQVGVFLLCLAPPALVLWLYRYEMKLIKPGTARVLLTLRLLGLFFIMALGLTQPVLQRTTIEELPGRVLIAVDRSDSMDVADPHRLAVEKLRLARALQLAPDICPDGQLDAWIQQYEAKGPAAALDFVAVAEFPDDPAKRRAVADERAKVYAQVVQRVDALTRTQTAQKVLLEGIKLLPTVAAKHQVELTGFALEQWDVKPELAETLFQQRLAPTTGTDLCLPLDRAIERPGLDEGKLLGIVLVTDGRHNGRESPRERTLALRNQKIPIYPLALGSTQRPAMVAIATLAAPPTSSKDVDASVVAGVRVVGMPAQELTVELQRPNLPPLVERIKHDGSKERVYSVQFRVRFEQVGAQGITVVAKPDSGVAVGDQKPRTDLSSRAAIINIADDKAKVLLIDGEARYEYHYLATALGRDPKMVLSKVVFNQPRVGKLSEEELKKLGNPALTLPTEPDGLAGFQCIILGDVAPEQLPLAERVRLEKYVADRGGTLVMLAGKRYMPISYALSPDGAAGEADPLWKLLPIVNPRPFASTRGFALQLTDDGERTSYLRMADGTLEDSRKRWNELPQHYWAVIGEAKPGAQVLASVADENAAPRDKASSIDDPARKRALIARQNYGFGRVLYVGLDSTWRWRKHVGDRDHHRFWSQVIHWAASDEMVPTGNDAVRFGTRQPVYRQGDEVEVLVRLADDVPPLTPEARAGARVLRVVEGKDGEEPAALILLNRKAAQPRLLEGKLRDLPPGKYKVELAIPEIADKLTGSPGPDGQPQRLLAEFSVTPRDSAEMLELSTDMELLRQLAGETEGQTFTPETAGGLAELLKTKVVTREVPSERKLWMEWITLALFLLLLTAEWVGRKMVGLP